MLSNPPAMLLGIIFSLIAAALNASIGIFSKLLISSGLTSNDIAFFKTLLAFIIISLILIKLPLRQQLNFITPHYQQNTKKVIFQIALCAFLGIFVLFYFETAAYQFGNASDVVVLLMAAASVSALLFGALLLQEKITLATAIGTLLSIAGIFIISWSGSGSFPMIINAILAGIGYGLFSVLVKKYQLQGGIYLTRLLLFFGSIYLAVPFIQHAHHITFNTYSVLGLLGLAIFPTIIGFYCTTKALVYLSAAKVQVTELSEPIFAMALAWFILNESPTSAFFIGAIFIITGILFINKMIKSPFSRAR